MFQHKAFKKKEQVLKKKQCYRFFKLLLYKQADEDYVLYHDFILFKNDFCPF